MIKHQVLAYYKSSSDLFPTAVISFYWMVLKREGLMMACNKRKLVAYFAYDCKVGNTYIWSTAQWGWITLKLEKDIVCWMELSNLFKAHLRTNFKQWDPKVLAGVLLKMQVLWDVLVNSFDVLKAAVPCFDIYWP